MLLHEKKDDFEDDDDDVEDDDDDDDGGVKASLTTTTTEGGRGLSFLVKIWIIFEQDDGDADEAATIKFSVKLSLVGSEIKLKKILNKMKKTKN